MSTLGKEADQIAAEISGSKYWQTIFPGKQALMTELNQTIAKNVSGKYTAEKTQDILSEQTKNIVDTFSLSDEVAQKAQNIVRSTNQSNLDENIGKLGETLLGDDKEVANMFFDKSREDIKNIAAISPENVKEEIGSIRYGMNLPKAYFSNPDKKIRNNRIAAAATAYAGVTVGGRYLSGGTLTTDNYGRKDIAGVPFL